MVAETALERLLLIVTNLRVGLELDRQLRVLRIVSKVVLLEERPPDLAAARLDLLHPARIDLKLLDARLAGIVDVFGTPEGLPRLQVCSVHIRQVCSVRGLPRGGVPRGGLPRPRAVDTEAHSSSGGWAERLVERLVLRGRELRLGTQPGQRRHPKAAPVGLRGKAEFELMVGVAPVVRRMALHIV